jgi:hypothetical protein
VCSEGEKVELAARPRGNYSRRAKLFTANRRSTIAAPRKERLITLGRTSRSRKRGLPEAEPNAT